MNLKPIVIIVLILLLAQALFFGDALRKSITFLDGRLSALESENQGLKVQKAQLDQESDRLRSDIRSIPPTLLAGFEDPEASFVEFLDYIQSPAFQRAGGKVALRGQKFLQKPIPLHESTFDFTYEFDKVPVAEAFLSHFVDQRRFPLQVTGFSATRTKGGNTKAKITVSLLIPARLQFEPPSATGKKEGK
jgi:hypothetical protein